MNYPYAQRQPIVEVRHGHRIEDPYRWLEDQDSPETQKWLAAQEELWRAHPMPEQDRLRARIAELTATGVVGPPIWRGGRRFRVRRDPGQEHPVLYADDRPLLDPMALDPAGTTVLDAWHPSPDGTLVAVQLSRRGTERGELYVMDAVTGQLVDGPAGECRHSPVAWLPSGDGFYYIRDGQARLRRLGGEDLPIAAADGLALSADGRWLTLASHQEGVRIGDMSTSAWQQVAPPGSRTVANVGPDGRLYLATTHQAPHGRLCVADPARPGEWTDLVPEDLEAVLADFALLDGALLVTRIRHAVSEITVHDPVTGKRGGTIKLPGHGTTGRMTTSGHEAWFTYTDYVTPESVYRYDARTGATTLWEAAPGVADLPEIESHQLVCPSFDGTPVRVVVLATPGDGPRPCVLYGYGGFGVPLTPTYSSYVLPWLESGGVFAFAQVRGGGEEGEAWHRAGMLDRKQNVFDDFAAVAKALVAKGWTTRDRLGLCGESNGGLLVGALLTQHPDLFAAAVCSAPVLDMARYERSGLGPRWRAEYGSADDAEALAWLLGYSPYHHVRAGVDYPATLFTVFGGDTRVDPLHARKMCAALQFATSGPLESRPILLRHEPEVGHGARSAGRSVELAADMLAFLRSVLTRS
ncbi:prolyl oligopeptidase family serine peptidase [Acrocarpospora catenulata]|uniref:prolyl oligopeptidase family serine peptidase n=1 Tax=Acrocarpospora catenulata TaxID=2836182 RepID=UPI001BD92889|nr:prolyl oligopeptidase family serine peptidase [Acrocarpospora catenulata]